MSIENDNNSLLEKIDLITPTNGKLFFELKNQETLLLCKPNLMPLKSLTLEKLEKMQKDVYEQLKKAQESGDTTDQLKKEKTTSD